MLSANDLSPEAFLSRIRNQKRRFLLLLAALISVAAVSHAFIRWHAGLKVSALLGLGLIAGAGISLFLAWRHKIAASAHIIIASAFLVTSLNQYAMASASIAPILNIFSIFMAAMYLLGLRWGSFYGILGFARALSLKILQDTGLFGMPPVSVPLADWYSSLVVAFGIFSYLLIALVRNYDTLLNSYRQAAVARQKFLAKLSHEIRTPLNALLGIGELLSARIVDPEKQKYMSTILSAGQNLLQIANQALEVSRREGQKTSAQEVYDPAGIVKQLARLFEAEAQRKNILLEVTHDTELPGRVLGDAIAVREILTNFLHNALKFTERGAIRIAVTSETDEKQTRLVYTVSDTGRGIPKEKIRAIFDPFDQGGAPTATADGVGLGLSICQDLSLQMGGTIAAQSQEGKGSVFTLRVPLLVALPESQGSEKTGQQRHLKAESRAKRILSVDDDRMNQMLIQAYLSASETELTAVHSGEEAVAACAQISYDLVLMDLNMPGLDGFEALRRIRSAELAARKKSVPAIAVTASVMPEEIERVRAAGFVTHLAKPLSQNDLQDTITAVLK